MSQLKNGGVVQRNNYFSKAPPVITLSKPEEFTTVVQIEKSIESSQQELKSWPSFHPNTSSNHTPPPHPNNHHLSREYKRSPLISQKKVQYQIDNPPSSSISSSENSKKKKSCSIATNTDFGVEILPSDNSSSVLSFPVEIEENLIRHSLRANPESTHNYHHHHHHHHHHDLPSQNLINNNAENSFLSKSSSTLINLLGREKFEKYSRLTYYARSVPPGERCFFVLLLFVTAVYAIGILTALILLCFHNWLN